MFVWDLGSWLASSHKGTWCQLRPSVVSPYLLLLIQMGVGALLSCPTALYILLWYTSHFYTILRQSCWTCWLEHMSSVQEWVQCILVSLEQGNKIQLQKARKKLTRSHLTAALPQVDPVVRPSVWLLHTHQQENVNKGKAEKPCDQGLCL